MKPGSYSGFEFDQSAWVLAAVDDGNATATGNISIASQIDLAQPMGLAPGPHGVTIVALTQGHAYTNGTGQNQNWAFGTWTLSAGVAQNIGWAAGPLFNPRVWNGSFCVESADAGTTFCGPAPSNSSGMPGQLVALGSAVAADNDLTLLAFDLPPDRFGIFLNSTDLVAPTVPAGSQGNLCLGSSLGRHAVFQTGPAGTATTALDLGNLPAPGGTQAVMAGETWGFQAWTRDASRTSILTAGVQVDFQ